MRDRYLHTEICLLHSFERVLALVWIVFTNRAVEPEVALTAASYNWLIHAYANCQPTPKVEEAAAVRHIRCVRN